MESIKDNSIKDKKWNLLLYGKQCIINIADYWILISFMTLEPDQQLQYFEYPP